MQIKSISHSSKFEDQSSQSVENVFAIRNVETRDQSRNRIDYLKNRMLIRDDLQDVVLKTSILNKNRVNMYKTTQGFGVHNLCNSTDNTAE